MQDLKLKDQFTGLENSVAPAKWSFKIQSCFFRSSIFSAAGIWYALVRYLPFKYCSDVFSWRGVLLSHGDVDYSAGRAPKDGVLSRHLFWEGSFPKNWK